MEHLNTFLFFLNSWILNYYFHLYSFVSISHVHFLQNLHVFTITSVFCFFVENRSVNISFKLCFTLCFLCGSVFYTFVDEIPFSKMKLTFTYHWILLFKSFRFNGPVAGGMRRILYNNGILRRYLLRFTLHSRLVDSSQVLQFLPLARVVV